MFRTYSRLIIEQETKASKNEKILFSSENFLNSMDSEMIDWLVHFSKSYRLTVICFVRDVYDFMVSMWKQRVKAGGYIEDLPTEIFSETMKNFNRLATLVSLSDAGLDIRLRSYDFHKKAIVEIFLQELGIDFETANLKQPQSSEANISFSYWQAQSIIMSNAIVRSARMHALMINRFRHQPDRRPDPYFPELDTKLLDFLGPSIDKINPYLPLNEKLRRLPRAEEVKSNTGYSKYNMEQIMEIVRDLTSHPQKLVPPAIINGLPLDFVPENYLLLNPDVALARMDPIYHYLNHGRFEGRTYKAGD